MKPIVPLLLASALGACSMAPKYERAALPVPPSWPIGDAYLANSERTLPTLSYRDIFRDPRLQRIVEQALLNNRDLRVAAANIEQARALYRGQRAAILPTVNAAGTGSYIKNSGSASNTFNAGTGRASFAANVGTSAFEIDLFGRIRSLSDAALNRYFGTEAAARTTRLALVADLADIWTTYAADRSLLIIARQTVTSARRSVDLTRRRLQGGIAPRSDVAQAETVLATAEADLALQTTAIAQDKNAIDLLVGTPVDPALLPATIESVLPTLAELPAGIDSTILLRRPDVVEAEYELRASNAEIGAARAELFPRLTLTGLAGFASDALGELFRNDSFTWQAGGGANYSIFRGGAGRATVRATEAQRDAALAGYERAIQTAFREVADALARRGTITGQLAATTRLEAAARDTFALTEAQYRGGVANFLQSLDAQRTLYSAQRQLVATRLVRAGNLVTLYRVLGGDALVTVGPNGPIAEGTGAPVAR